MSALRRWLVDMLYHIDLAQTFTADTPYEDFRDDLQKLYAGHAASKSFPKPPAAFRMR